MSTPTADPAANRRLNQTAPSARRAGWISIGVVTFFFSAIVLATQPDDDSVASNAGTAAEAHIPAVLSVVAQIIGWEQNRHE